MCGIIAVIAKHGDLEKAREAMMEQFENQHSRGNRGFGLIELTQKGYRVRKATEPIKALLDVRMSDAGILLFHHRYPTSTENTLNTAHPIKVSHPELSGDWFISHNGVIRNCDELKKKHEALGYVYTTIEEKTTHYNSSYQKYNDSEAFAIELVRLIEGKTEEAEWVGPAAFIGTKINKKTGKPSLVVFGRGNSNPLQVLETEDNLIIASEIPGKNVFDLEEKNVSVLTMKAIFDPSKWPSKSENNTPLLDMSITGELKLKEPPVTPVSHTHYPNRNGFLGNSVKKTTGLLEAGRSASGKDDERMHGNAIIRLERGGPTEDTEEEEDLSPRAKAFFKMADKATDKIANVVNDLFQNLSEGEVDDKDMAEYMKDIEAIIRDRFQGAERARYHLDKFEETLAQNIPESHISSNGAGQDAMDTEVDKAIDSMTG